MVSCSSFGDATITNDSFKSSCVVKETEICEDGFEKKEEEIVSVQSETERTVNDVKETEICAVGSVKSETERVVKDLKEKDIVKREVGFQEFEEKKSVVEVETSSLASGIEEDSFLEAKKKQLLEEIEVGSIFVNKVPGFASFSGIDGKENGCQEVTKLVHNDADGSVRCSLKIEVIDDTALIESVPVHKTGNDNVKEAGVMGFAKGTERKGKKNEKQEVGGKKAKRSRRKAKDVKMDLELSQWHQNLLKMVEDQNSGRKNGDGTKRMYSREEMEALRFVNIVEQRKMWKVIYTGFAPAVLKGYDDLASLKHQKQIRLNFDPWQQFGRKDEVPGILSPVAARRRRNHLHIFVH